MDSFMTGLRYEFGCQAIDRPRIVLGDAPGLYAVGRHPTHSGTIRSHYNGGGHGRGLDRDRFCGRLAIYEER